MIKVSINITSSKILAIVLAVAGIVISIVMKDSTAFEVGAMSSAALMGTKTVTERYRVKDRMSYNQEPKETID